MDAETDSEQLTVKVTAKALFEGKLLIRIRQ
jgi:hypothetical protein